MYDNLVLALVVVGILAVVMIAGDLLFGDNKNENERWRKLPKDNEAVRHTVRVRKEVSTRRREGSGDVPKVQDAEPHKVDIDRF